MQEKGNENGTNRGKKGWEMGEMGFVKKREKKKVYKALLSYLKRQKKSLKDGI